MGRRSEGRDAGFLMPDAGWNIGRCAVGELALILAWTHSLPLVRLCGPAASSRIPFAASQAAQVSPGRRNAF